MEVESRRLIIDDDVIDQQYEENVVRVVVAGTLMRKPKWKETVWKFADEIVSNVRHEVIDDRLYLVG